MRLIVSDTDVSIAADDAFNPEASMAFLALLTQQSVPGSRGGTNPKN
jgi:hypothetical protein